VTAPDESKVQLRGSSLLLVGRLLATAVNFVTQVLVVRALSKDGYGAFAYALSIVNVIETTITLGLDRAVSRFVPIYDEQGDAARMRGTLSFVGRVLVVASVVVVAMVVLAGSELLGRWTDDVRTGQLIVLLVALAPLQAFDNLLLGVSAVFTRARAIFFRRYVLAPALRLGAVLFVVLGQGDERDLALGYVVTAAAGLGVFLWVLGRALAREGVLRRLRETPADRPVRTVLAFTLPLLTSDLVFVALESVDVVLLGRYGTTAEVASLRAVQPVARLNQLVLASFGVLFTPLAARRFARGDRAGVADLYWQTAAWVAVLSFPAVLVTVALAPSLTVTLFGDRYRESALLLAVLSAGYAINAALGFNGLTLNVFGQVRMLMVVNLGAAGVNVALGLLLIPRFGAAGAAWSTFATLVAHNALRQIALRRGTGVPLFDRRYLGVYGLLVLTASALTAGQRVFDPPLPVGVAAVGMVTVAVFARVRHVLELGDTFPELARLPLVGRLLAGR
jgi:O-antigen/teichoic acid export membrane protein